MSVTTNVEQQLAELSAKVNALGESNAQLQAERDEYKHQYILMMEAYRKLEAGLTRHKRERFAENPAQTTMSLLGMLTGETETTVAEALPDSAKVRAYNRASPTGRKPLPENLPRIIIEVVPPDVQRAGLDAFHRMGEDVCETTERRPASVVVVRTVRPKYMSKAAYEALQEGQSTPILQASPLELPIPRALAGPGLLADTIVKRWVDHLPLHRLERVYGREGLPLARSTVCGWHFSVADLASSLVEAMFRDAWENSPYLCTDATGVLVQDADKCRRGHFFVVVAPGKHVLFRYTPKHNADAVDEVLGTYRGFLVADAHSVYEHLYSDGIATEVACWAHSRRYFFKSVDSDGARARHGLSLIQKLFALERDWAKTAPDEKLKLRQQFSKPVVDAFFAWCEAESLKVLDETPISIAIGYARNQREALNRFLTDGRLPIHNNISENALRRQALGRKNWLFLGTDEGGEVNATLVSLLASCEMHKIEPLAYLRDLLCLLPSWPVKQVLDLSPARWEQTLQSPEVQQALTSNVFRQAALGALKPSTVSG